MQQLNVFHGSRQDFEVFDPSCCITADHLYTTLDRSYAKAYGDNILEFKANLGRHLELRPENLYDGDYLETFKILRQAHAEVGIDFGYDDFDEFVQVLTSGDMYQLWSGPKFQNAILNYFFASGYDSVSIVEIGPGRMIADVVIFNDPTRLTRMH